jgi:hypothetical protein
MKAISSEGISKGCQCSADTASAMRWQARRNFADDLDPGRCQVEPGDGGCGRDQDHHRRQFGEHFRCFSGGAKSGQGARQIGLRQPQGKQRSQSDESRSADGYSPAARPAAVRADRWRSIVRRRW